MNAKSLIAILLAYFIFNPILQAKCLYDDCELEDSFLAKYTNEELLEGVDIDSLIIFREDLENCQISEYGCRGTFREAGLMGLYGFFLKSLDWKLSLADEAAGLSLRDNKSKAANADAVRAAESAASPAKPTIPSAVPAARAAAYPSPIPSVSLTPTPWEDALLNRGSVNVRKTFRAIARNPIDYQMNAQFISSRRLRITGANRDIVLKFRRFGRITTFVCPSLKNPGRFFQGKCSVIGRDTQAMLSNRAGMNRFIAGIKGELPQRFVLNPTVTRSFWRRWVFSWRGLGILTVLGGGYLAVQSYNNEGIVADLTPWAVEKLKSAVDFMLLQFSNSPLSPDDMLFETEPPAIDGGDSKRDSNGNAHHSDGVSGATRLVAK